MEAVTQSLIDGKFEYDTGSLDLSCHKIELSIEKGGSVRGSFLVSSHNGKPVTGKVTADRLRMKCLTPEFVGEQAEIYYVFSGEGMEEGDVHKGEFSIISNAGEYTVPYVVSVEHGVIESSIGPVKNLFHFANLAKTNWKEAVALFYRPEFSELLHGSEARYLGAYRGLSRVRGNEQNVDEFLVEVNKKQPITYQPMEERIRMEDPEGVAEGRITVTRNGWGYTALAVETDGDFLSVEKKVLTDDDFLGNLCNFAFHVDSEKLHAGNNYGCVRLFNAVFDVEIQILVTRPIQRPPLYAIQREMRRLTLEMMELYGKFRTKKITASVWLRESGRTVERMNVIDEKSIPARLFHAQLLITEERNNEAKWILEQVTSELSYSRRKPEHWCYYLYLTSLINRSEAYVNEVSAEVEQIFAENPGNWRIAWLLLYLREEFSKSPYKKWMFLDQQFYEGCTSPVLYMEAYSLLSVNPTLLMKLSEFEIQVLNYAAKAELLKKDLILQIQTLVSKVKTYSARLLFILEKCYEAEEDDETLQMICTLLMKGERTDEMAFFWYALGVEREIRVTRLFEFYMMSLPEDYDRELPKMVMMYFAYHSELDYEKTALLYTNILKHSDRFPEIAQTYREPMERFLLEQIDKGHMNKNLAYLYRELLQPAMMQEETLTQLIPLLFSNLVTVEDARIKQVILIHGQLTGENVYPVTDGKAVLPIYGSDYRILLEDESGNRRIAGDPYVLEKLMIPGRFIKELNGQVQNHLGLDLYLCENLHSSVKVTEKNVACYRRLWDSDRLTDAFRREIRLKLITYYYENDAIYETDELLEQLRPGDMNARERGEVMRILAERGMYEKAYEWLCAYGEEQIESSIVVRVLSRLLIRSEFKPDMQMLKLTFRIFKKGKYDENILRYLIAYYEGPTRDMRDIWKAAADFELEVNDLCERILLQILFTGFYIGEKNEMFYSYVKRGAKRSVELAYLSHEAYDYFVKGHVMDEKIFPYYTRLFYRGEELHDVCRLAYLKYYASSIRTQGEEVLQLARRFLEEFMSAGMHFPFFKEYIGIVGGVEFLADKTMIEYHASPGSRVTLHYVIEKGSEGGEYVTEPMINMYEGIFVRSFVLFFGETLQYYITEENESGEQLTESATISKNDTDNEERESGYRLLNDLVVAGTLQDYSTYHSLYEEYEHRKFMAERLFPL